jgi:hypothetical protein
MVRALTMNLIPNPQKSKEEKLTTGQTPSQYPLMTNQMAKARREIHRHPARITLLTDTNKTMLPLAIRPTCRHQSIRRSKSQREGSSYATMMARENEAMMWGPRFTTRNSRYAYNSRSHDQYVVSPHNRADIRVTSSITVPNIKSYNWSHDQD